MKVEVNLLKRPRRVEVDPEVLVVKESLYRVVGRLLDRVLAACRRLDEEGLLDLSVALLEQDPAVEPLVADLVFALEVRLVIVNGNGLVGSVCLGVVLGPLHLVVVL